jgi:hypothetical protein
MAGLTRWECMHLPVGQVNDQVACWQIATGRAKEQEAERNGAPFKKTVHEQFFNS